MDSRKRGDSSLTSPLGGGRPGRVKKKSLKVAAKEAAGSLELLGLPMLALVLGLSWSPGPSLLMEGPIAPYASHSHGPSP
ncbi:hypothetical protein AAG906_031826 [Vitis piasezkii]